MPCKLIFLIGRRKNSDTRPSFHLQMSVSENLIEIRLMRINHNFFIQVAVILRV